MSEETGLIRRKSKGFVQISNTVLRDKKLSLKAKGLYSLIESFLTLENWVLYKGYIVSQCKEKETSFDGAWKELKKAGYLIQHKLRSEKTGKWIYEYELSDEPILANNEEKTTPRFSTPGFSTPGFSTPGLSTPGKQGVYTNTDLTNTDLTNTDEEIREGKPSFTALSDIVPAILPVECIADLDKYFIGRLKKERCFYNCDFNIGLYYNAFADALVKTQLQDSVEILTMNQYAYFLSTLKKLIEPLEMENKLLGWAN